MHAVPLPLNSVSNVEESRFKIPFDMRRRESLDPGSSNTVGCDETIMCIVREGGRQRRMPEREEEEVSR